MTKITMELKQFNKIIKIVNQTTFENIIHNNAKELQLVLFREKYPLDPKLKCFIRETSIIKLEQGLIHGDEIIRYIDIEEIIETQHVDEEMIESEKKHYTLELDATEISTIMKALHFYAYHNKNLTHNERVYSLKLKDNIRHEC
jgi:hypothetical protein